MVFGSVGSAARPAMRPLDGSPPVAPFTIGAGPLGTQVESRVRSSKISNRGGVPRWRDDRSCLMVDVREPRTGSSLYSVARTASSSLDARGSKSNNKMGKNQPQD